MARPKKYDAEFRAQAVRLVREEKKPVSRVAADLGISDTALSNWIREAAASAQPPAVNPLEEENRRLRQENRILQMERDILKKAAAFFAKESL